MMPSYSSMVDNTAEVLMEIDSPTKNYLPPPSANKTPTKITAATNGIILKMDSETADQNAITTSSVNAANNDGDGDDGQQQQLEQPSKTKEKTELQLLMEKIKPSSYGQRRNFSSIDISAEKWLMAYDQASITKLENPPSLADGISHELEKDIRYLGCELIQSGAILLKLNQTAAATGQILFQRFYYQKSFVRYNFEHMVMACLLLASKIEEEPRKPRDVLNVYHRLKQLHQHRRQHPMGTSPEGPMAAVVKEYKQRPKKFEHLELGGRQYLHTKNLVIKAERRLLNTLGFVVHVHHPHKLVYIYLHVLGLLQKESDPNVSTQQIGTSQQLLQRAWSYMNDGLRTDMFLRYTPETIACACIQLAVKTIDQPIVLPKEPFPWFELFDASDRDVRAISQMLLDLYNRKKAPSVDWILLQLEKLQQKMAEEEKAKQDKELAQMREAIAQRKSESAIAAAALSGYGTTGTDAADEARSRASKIMGEKPNEKAKVVIGQKRAASKDRSSGGGVKTSSAMVVGRSSDGRDRGTEQQRISSTSSHGSRTKEKEQQRRGLMEEREERSSGGDRRKEEKRRKTSRERDRVAERDRREHQRDRDRAGTRRRDDDRHHHERR